MRDLGLMVICINYFNRIAAVKLDFFCVNYLFDYRGKLKILRNKLNK